MVSVEYNRLRWQCRRGVTELDRLLVAFLESDYLHLTDQEKNLFSECLLTLEDDVLYHYLFMNKAIENIKLKKLVQKIRASLNT